MHLHRRYTLVTPIAILFIIISSGISVSKVISYTTSMGEASGSPASSDVRTQDTPMHPHLFFTADDIPRLKEQAATTHESIWLPIQEYAERARGTRPPATVPEDGVDFRIAGDEMRVLAFACVVGEDPQDCSTAINYLVTYASWNQWDENGARDLGHSHMLIGNALAYDWLYPRLTSTQQTLVRDSLASWTEKMFYASLLDNSYGWSNWWSTSYMQNHYSTANSALGISSLALLGEFPEANAWLDRAEAQISRARDILNNIRDGSWHESMTYQNYMLAMMVPYMVIERDLEGVDLLPHTYLKNFTYWRLYNHLPDTVQFIFPYGNFEWEWGNSRQIQFVLRFIANEYKDGHAEWLAQDILGANERLADIYTTPWYVYEFLFYDPDVEAVSPDALPLARVFTDFGGVIWRTGWHRNDLVFALRSGAYGGRYAYETFIAGTYPWGERCPEINCQLNIGHNHADAGSFYIYRNDTWLVQEREGFDIRETSYHNSLLIDGQGQYIPPESWRIPEEFANSDGFLEATGTSANFNYVAADVTHRYIRGVPDLQDFTRHVVFLRPDYFVMLDNIVALEPHDYDSRIHLGGSAAQEGLWIKSDGGRNQIMGIGVVSPANFIVTSGDDGRPYVDISPSSNVDSVRYVNLLYPTSASGWERKPTPELLEDNGNASVVRLTFPDGRQDDVAIAYENSRPDHIVGSYCLDGQVSVVRRGTVGELTSLYLFGSSYLIDQNAESMLVGDLVSSGSVEFTFSDNLILVSGDRIVRFALYAPEREQLFINDVEQAFTREGDYVLYGGASLDAVPDIDTCSRVAD